MIPIAALLDDPMLTVRAAASLALRSFSAPAVAPIAKMILASPRPRSVAVETLGRIAFAVKDSTSASTVRARGVARSTLMSALDLGIAQNDPELRAAAASALLKLGEPEVKEFVRLRTLDETDPLVKRSCERATEGTK
jgi:HEAT repeat protein